MRACGEEPSAPSAPGSGQQAAGAGAGKEERVPAGRYLRRQSLLLVVLPGQHPPQLLHAQSWGRAAPRRTGRDGPTGSDATGGAVPRLRTGAVRPPAAGEPGSFGGPRSRLRESAYLDQDGGDLRELGSGESAVK